MQQQKSFTTGAIVMHTVEFQQGFQSGLDGAYVVVVFASVRASCE